MDVWTDNHEPQDHFYPEAFFIGSDAWHKFVAAVGDAFCSNDPQEARCLILMLLYQIACVPNVEVTFVALDPDGSSLPFGPRMPQDDFDGPCLIAHDWLDRANDFSVVLSFAGDAEEARDRVAPERSSYVEDYEKRANESLSTRVAISWLNALGITGHRSASQIDAVAEPDERHWTEGAGKLNGGDVVQLFADVLKISRSSAACRVLSITDDDQYEFYTPKSSTFRAKAFIDRQRARWPSGDDEAKGGGATGGGTLSST